MHASTSGLRCRARLARTSASESHSVRTMPSSSARSGSTLAHAAAEGQPQIGHVLVTRRAPQAREVDADEAIRHEHPAGFFEHFADDALLGRFARFEMAGRIVEPQAFGRVLFDEEEFGHAVDAPFDDRGDGDAWFPAFGHLAIVGRPGGHRAASFDSHRLPRVASMAALLDERDHIVSAASALMSTCS